MVLTYLTTCALPETRSATARNNKGLSTSRDTREVPTQLITSYQPPILVSAGRRSVPSWGSGGEAAHTDTSVRRSARRRRTAPPPTSTNVKSIGDRSEPPDRQTDWLDPVCFLVTVTALQVCKDVWQNQCRGSKRRLRRSPRRPYWLDKNNIETIFDSQNFPLTPSDVPFADPGQGATYEFASPPKSKSCWKKVRKCEWKKYKTSCRNEPTVTCKPGTIKNCRNRCKNRWFCDKCPTTSKPKPKPTKKPVGPTRPPRPAPTKPSKPGPPAPPPLGTFIGPPGIPIKQDVGSVIDVRRQKKLPWPSQEEVGMMFSMILITVRHQWDYQRDTDTLIVTIFTLSCNSVPCLDQLEYCCCKV